MDWSVAAVPPSELVRLSHVLGQFEAPLSEEQAWALAHQTLLCAQRHFARAHSRLLAQPQHVLLTRDGHVHPLSLTQDSDQRELARSASRLLASLGVLLFRALDFGLREDEERRLSRPLEALVDALTNQEAEEEDEGFQDQMDRSCSAFEPLIQRCAQRVQGDPRDHYASVLRALVLEALELKEFLEKVTAESRPRDQEPRDPPLVTADWLRLWIQVVRELRAGVRLRHVAREHAARAEFALTPYEMLLSDIRLKNYSLNHVTAEARAPLRKDAHALILEFIRSRPPLAPAGARALNPLPLKEVSVYEKLMQSIRQKDHKLRPTQTRHKWASEAALATPAPPGPAPAQSLTPGAPRRRLIKANLNLDLNNSFDDSDDADDAKGDAPHDATGQKPESAEGPPRRRFSLRNLSLRLVREPRAPALDVNEDARNHVASIWEASEWGRALECLSLTLAEVQHIRSVLTKAELETLAVTQELRADLLERRICFTCLKTRFSFFGARPNTCKVCERAICDRCASRMHIPAQTFDKVPIYMLSPTPSPPDPPDRPWPAPAPPRPQMEARQSLLPRALRKDVVLVDAGMRKTCPLVRVCRDCKRLVRHLIDTGSASFA